MRTLIRIAATALFSLVLACAGPALAQPDADLLAQGGDIEVGETGWDNKRPVIATACPFGCPWGELAEFVHDAMEPYGYDVVFCRNCNRGRGPGMVSTAALPPELDDLDARTGTTYRVDAPVDFGITASGILGGAYRSGADNLRLIAKIEDPTFLLVAVKAETGITDLSQIRENEMPVRILAGGLANEVLAHYDITPADIEAWGGSVNRAMGARQAAEFDVMIGDHGTPFMNPEGSHWQILSQLHDLNYLDIPDELVDELAELPGYEAVTTKWGMLAGMDRPIRTVARSGEVIFAREDTPEQAAYDVARAIDESRRDLMFLIRRYSIDPRTVYEDQGVPLHPGAERYYREAGYID